MSIGHLERKEEAISGEGRVSYSNIGQKCQRMKMESEMLAFTVHRQNDKITNDNLHLSAFSGGRS